MAQLNPRIEAKLRKIPDVAVEAARRAMEEGAQQLVDMMKASVPARSGALRASIGWTWGELPPGTFMIEEVRSGRNAGEQFATLQLKIYAGSKDAFYARFVEFGTQAHSLARNANVARGSRQDQGGRHLGTPAQPFFFPAWRKMRAEWRREIRKQVRAAIRDAWRRS